eukprot:g23486.t1
MRQGHSEPPRKARTVKSDKKSRKERSSVYIYKVMKQVHQDTSVFPTATNPPFVSGVFELVAGLAFRLTHDNKRSTVSSQEIQTGVCLLLPGELAKHALLEGTKSVTKHTSS